MASKEILDVPVFDVFSDNETANWVDKEVFLIRKMMNDFLVLSIITIDVVQL